MFFLSLVKRIRQKIRIFRVSRHNDRGYHRVKFYRGCAIDLIMRVTSNLNEVWNYYAVLGDGENDSDELIAKGNGLATEDIAMKCAKDWIDDVLRDRENIELRKNWLSKKMKSRHKRWLSQYLRKTKLSNKSN